ncbi:LPS export ABC transporter periplasmic protein LptC [Marinomonas balearica]|uniref:Lipopolysaccharide export system protein LptC n=1 Tax=Marinomonas balearica TaxID=491947 RepID=A0A4R6MDS1_9GAMM|nr:LPS export ABC transporter periplasmic protein LptC [Marinomonas balearica]TDO99887.1 lipopolysaccharide export system protein LptC [Marinomonas balearica]
MKILIPKEWLQKTGIVFTIAACVIAFFWYGASPTTTLVSKDELSNTPDYFLENVTSKEFTADGQLEQIIRTSKLSHYNINKQTTAVAPKIETTTDGIVWHAEADFGQLNDTNKDVLLTSNASVVRKDNNINSNKLNADVIHYNGIDKSLISEGNAKLTTPQGITLADTIRSYINLETAQLKGNVSGHYEQATQNK